MLARTSQAARVAQVLVIGALSALASPVEVRADEPHEPMVSMDVQDAPLLELTLQMSRITGQNFVLLDKDLEGKRITIYAPRLVTIEEARQLFISALRLQGLTVVDAGSYWKIDVL